MSFFSRLLTKFVNSQPDPVIVKIFREVKRRVPYKPYAKYDYRYVPKGEIEAGNCALFAYTAYIDLERAGYRPEMVSCSIKETGQRHVYVRVNGWALDVRNNDIVRANTVDCI